MKDFIISRRNLALFFVLICSVSIYSSEPSIWSVNSRADVLKGDARGVSIDMNGRLSLSPKLMEVYNTDQPYIWSSAIDAGGSVFLGTGGEGKIFKVSASGSGELFADLNELNVTAMAIGKNGEVFAATSPDGKVYQIEKDQKISVYFDAKQKYIWSLAVMADGSLAVATGDAGKIYRVRAPNASLETSLLFDTGESHVTTLVTDKAGNLYAGTDSNGIVLKFGLDGKPFALLDSPLREIHQIAPAADGSIYVLALGESASASAAPVTPTVAATPETKTVLAEKVLGVSGPAPKSRYELTGAKSAIYRITPDGNSDIIWTSTTVTGFSIAAQPAGNGVLLGTSDKGRIYNIGNDARETLVVQTDASQISTMKSFGQGFYATSSNQGRLFKFGTETVAEGIYESAILDARSNAVWGRIWWRSTGNIHIETRSGNTEKADATWSSWSAINGAESGQIGSPKARYLQWRATLKSSSVGVWLNEVNAAFLVGNIAPEVLSLQILPVNMGLAANPPMQIDPNIELSGLDPSAFGIPNVMPQPRKIYQRGARSFQWTAEDRNGDKLVHDVFFKEVRDTDYKLLRANITESFITIDGLSLADGRYVIKVIAKDISGNPVGQNLFGEKISEPFDIDNSQPVVTALGLPQVTGDRAKLKFAATDKASYLVRAEYSVDGGDWQTVYPDDGIADSPNELYTIEIPLRGVGEYTVTLRVFDASGNAGNARIIVTK